MKPTDNHPQRRNNFKLRPGEGTVVRFLPEKGAVAGSTFMAAVDLASVPVPDKKYVADVCSVARSGSVIKLYFGQCPVPAGELITLVVINMSIGNVRNCISAIDHIKDPSYADIRDREGLRPVLPLNVGDLRIPAQTVTLSATLALSAMAGQESSIDFFKSSAFAMSAASSAGQLAVDPVVRIDMSSELFLGLLDGLREVAAQSPKGE